MTTHVEGTVLLEGLVEGRLPITPGASEKLEKWAEFGFGGVPVSLKIEGPRFSVLPSDAAVKVSLFKDGDAQQAIAEALDEMLRIFPPGDRGAVFSTLRSREFKPKQEIQTMYAVAPEGRIAIHSQTVAAETEAPPVPMTRKEFWMQMALGAGIAIILLLVSTLFVDYRKLFHSITHRTDVSHVAVEAGEFTPYFTVEKTLASPDSSKILITIRRGADFPMDDPAVEGAASRAATQPNSIRARLVLEAIARGYVQVEQYNDKDEFIGTTRVRIAGLRNKETVEVEVPMPEGAMREPVPPKRMALLPG